MQRIIHLIVLIALLWTNNVRSACLTSTCTLIPEAVEGPYYADDMLVRQDITEGNTGITMILNVTVIDTNTCQPIVGAAVDIWHCNSQGVYSAYESEGTEDETFLRGIQFTDGNGIASFKTIYPGWYQGRVTHIHIKVHINSTIDESNGSITGGHVSHTGQLFFNETFTAAIAQLSPYNQHSSVARTALESDGIYKQSHGEYSLLDLQFLDPTSSYSGGIVGSIVLGVDSTAVRNSTDSYGRMYGQGWPAGQITLMVLFMMTLATVAGLTAYVVVLKRRAQKPAMVE